MSNKDTFVWTDELVNEYVGTSLGETIQDMEYFKKSKMPEPKKEWEIVSMINSHGVHDYISKNDHRSDSCENRKCKIYSVKRLSDGEVFSVGDEVNWSLPEHRGEKPWIITSFQINKMLPTDRMFCNNQNMDIVYLTKLKSQPQEQSKRIEVVEIKKFDLNPTYQTNVAKYKVLVTREIPIEKMVAMKAAIERVLNDESDDIHDMVKKMEQMGWLAIKREEFYFQLRDAEEKAFNAARGMERKTNVRLHNSSGDSFYMTYLYPTFDDYKKSKQP